MTEEAAMRRTPQQARSQQRVDEILDAAGALLLENGYEALSTSTIAKRVGISIGSLYQFFANKEAVVQALAERYLAEMSAKNAAMFSPDSIYLPIPIFMQRIVEGLVSYSETHKGFHYLLNSAWVSPEIAAVAEAMGEEIVGNIVQMMAVKAPHLPEERRLVCAQTIMYAFKGLLTAIETAEEQQRAAFIEEFIRLGVAYWEAIAQEDTGTAAKS